MGPQQRCHLPHPRPPPHPRPRCPLTHPAPHWPLGQILGPLVLLRRWRRPLSWHAPSWRLCPTGLPRPAAQLHRAPPFRAAIEAPWWPRRAPQGQQQRDQQSHTTWPPQAARRQRAPPPSRSELGRPQGQEQQGRPTWHSQRQRPHHGHPWHPRQTRRHPVAALEKNKKHETIGPGLAKTRELGAVARVKIPISLSLSWLFVWVGFREIT